MGICIRPTCFRLFPSEEVRRIFPSYLLSNLLEFYHSFVEHFTEFWREDAKPIYQRSGGFYEHLTRGFLSNVLCLVLSRYLLLERGAVGCGRGCGSGPRCGYTDLPGLSGINTAD